MKYAIVLSCLLITGCLSGSNKTPQMGEITKVSNLYQIEGVYLNTPTSDGEPLTSAIFKDHNRGGKFVRVKAINDSDLLVEALSESKEVLNSEVFTKGKDFSFSGGQIKLNSSIGAEGFEKGSLAIGLVQNNKGFVFNEKGDALLKKDSNAAVSSIVYSSHGS